MRSVFVFMMSVSGLVCVLAFFAAWQRLRPSSRAARRWLTVAAVLYGFASIYAVPFTLSRTLVAGFHRFSAADAPRAGAIVLLGAGSATILDGSRHLALLDRTGAARVLEAARVYELIGPVWIISSGGVSESSGYREPSSVTMRQALVQLGIPESKIVVESSSQTTHDEAVLIAPMLRSLGVTQSVLVTSDIHMRRSLGSFRSAGMVVVPAIAPDPFADQPIVNWAVPTGNGLRLSEALIHESFGIAYYGVRGWWRF